MRGAARAAAPPRRPRGQRAACRGRHRVGDRRVVARLEERHARRDHLRRVAPRGLALERDVALARDVEAVPVRAAPGPLPDLERLAAVRAPEHRSDASAAATMRTSHAARAAGVGATSRPRRTSHPMCTNVDRANDSVDFVNDLRLGVRRRGPARTRRHPPPRYLGRSVISTGAAPGRSRAARAASPTAARPRAAVERDRRGRVGRDVAAEHQPVVADPGRRREALLAERLAGKLSWYAGLGDGERLWRWTPRWTAAADASATSAAPATPPPQQPPAKRHYERDLALFACGRVTGVDDARELGRGGAVVALPVAGADGGDELLDDREMLAARLGLQIAPRWRCPRRRRRASASRPRRSRRRSTRPRPRCRTASPRTGRRRRGGRPSWPPAAACRRRRGA